MRRHHNLDPFHAQALAPTPSRLGHIASKGFEGLVTTVTFLPSVPIVGALWLRNVYLQLTNGQPESGQGFEPQPFTTPAESVNIEQ